MTSLGLTTSALVIMAIIVLLCWAVREFGSAIWYAGKLRGPVAYPLIGNGLQFLNLPRAEFLPVLKGLIDRYGDCVRLWLGTHLIVLINDPKDIESLLSNPKCIDKSVEYNFFRLWMGDGLLTSTGQKWRSHRKIITPSFHFKILEQFVEIFDQQSSILVRKLESLAGETGESFDLFPLVSLCTLDIFYESSMGVTINAQLNSESSSVRAVKEMTSLIQDRFYDVLLRYEFFFRFSANRRRQLKALEVLHGYTDRVIMAKREELEKRSARVESTRTDGVEEVGSKQRKAFLEMLLQSTIDGRPLTDLEIRDEVNTFMLGGHDTTITTISFLLHSIANYDSIQQKLFEEVRSIVGDDPSQPTTMAMLHEMHYLELVIKETLRLYPSVPLFGRKMKENTEINGKIFPAGANVVVCPFLLGRNPKHFPDPMVFDPERFNVETSAEKRNPYQYIPFGAGPRNCIGQKFAILEIKSVVSKVLRHYEIVAAPEQQEIVLVAETVLRPQHGLPIRIRPRRY